MKKINKSTFGLIAIACVFVFACHSVNDNTSSFGFYVTRDSIAAMVESGQLASMNSSVMLAPGNWRMEYRLQYLAPEASYVQQGDTVVTFDTEQTQSQLDEAGAQLALKQAKLKEVQEKNAQILAQKIASLQQLELEYEINRERSKTSVFESQVMQQQMALELQKTEQRLKTARQELESQKILNQNSENLIRLEMSQAQMNIGRSRSTMADMFMIAPRGGLVIYEKHGWEGEGSKVKIGDVVYPQSAILSIPDLSAMKAVVKLNEVDRPHIKPGMAAEIIVEAYPDTVFAGHILSVSKIVNLAEESTNVKTYDVDIELHSGENFRLKPGLSAKVTIFCDSLKNTSRLPVWCMFNESAKYFVVSEAGRKTPVELILLNDGYAFVRGDISNGLALKSNAKAEKY